MTEYECVFALATVGMGMNICKQAIKASIVVV